MSSAPDLSPIDMTSLLRPGVFLLLRHGRVSYIGKAKCILIALAHHALRNRNTLPAWFPIQPIPFDAIQIIPCDPVRAIALHSAMVALHDPIHNRPLKPAATHIPPSLPAVRRASSLSRPSP